MSQSVDTSIQTARHVRDAPDCIVVGAGVFGLWAARHALRRGERVLVLERRQVGSGASGGFLGALMPHMPERWNARKQAQYNGLISLPAAIAELEADTGMDCGYRRCGRLMPLRHERMLAHVEERIAGARANWLDGGQQAFTMEHVAPEEIARRFPGPDGKPWLDPAIAPFGAQYDTLSARVDPRACLMALAAFARDHTHGEICEEAEVAGVDTSHDGANVRLADGSVIAAGRVVIANGWEAYDLLDRLNGGAGVRARGQKVSGRGVKGQAVLLDLPHDDELPILYDSGSYVVPHGAGMGAGMGADERGRENRVAVGSTSVDDWLSQEGDRETGRSRFDGSQTRFLDHARALCPSLRDAVISRQWANVRPRNTILDPETGKVGTQALLCPVEDQPRLSLAIGGFKTGFAVGHLQDTFTPDTR